jgi:ferredoxin-type protein NapF
MNRPTDHSRRAFFGLRSGRAQPAAIRPPWSVEASLAEHCTHCGACIAACPEKILRSDAGGVPEVDFSAGACTFCGDCAKSCTVPVFDLTRSPAWQVEIVVSDRCLPKRGILCESCRDVCIDGAIRFVRSTGQAPVPAISKTDCTGCGGCISVCPAGAISAAWREEAAHV